MAHGTVTAQVALWPLEEETVMMVVPEPTARTYPVELTEATELLLELQVTRVSVALDGVTVAES